MSTWSNITEGYTYEFCFLKIDIAGHSEISKALRTKAVENTLNQFEGYVEEIVTSHRGQIWSWQGDGGLCAFYEDHNEVDKFHDAVQCGIALLEGLTEFNRTSKISEDIQVRIAVHSGNAKYKEEKGRIHSEVINFVAHLEQNSDVNAISISEAVWRQCRKELQQLFHSQKEKFEGTSVYVCEKYGPGISKNWMKVRKGIDTIVKKLVDGNYRPDLVIGFGRSGAIIGAMLAGNLDCKGFCSLDRRVTKKPRFVQVEDTAQLNAKGIKKRNCSWRSSGYGQAKPSKRFITMSSL